MLYLLAKVEKFDMIRSIDFLICKAGCNQRRLISGLLWQAIFDLYYDCLTYNFSCTHQVAANENWILNYKIFNKKSGSLLDRSLKY